VKLSELPSVDELLRDPRLSAAPHGLAVEAARTVLDRARAEIRAGQDPGELAELVSQEIATAHAFRLRSAVNATGVIVHTNLGRAPLPTAALERVAEVGGGYSNLEYDLAEGRRGSRQDHVVAILRRLTGAEAALVVNNNAAAVLLALAALAEGREVLVSRGELIEIGDGFRIPDVLARSGARLVEVGTTNRTRAADYERAAGPETAVLLRVHQSNFRVVGFTDRPSLAELSEVAGAHDLALVDDLGSGALVPLGDEPQARESLAAGAELVCFSGDKLLGGPQAGIVVGRAELVEKLRRHPLQRALRADKLTLAALEGTLTLYLDPERARREIPVLRMLDEPAEAIRARAERLAAAVDGEVEDTIARVGGGALPLAELPSCACAVEEELAAPLRLGEPPVVGVVRDGRLLLDCRTVSDAEVDLVAAAVLAARSGKLDRPRSNADAAELERKRSLLHEPHVAPLTEFVQRLRDDRNADDVPWFDPTDAGANATILVLFEAPGRRGTHQGSAFVSCDNDDPSAENMWNLLREADIDRAREYVAWNIVPWYIGDEGRGGNATAADIEAAQPALSELISLLPKLRVVVLCGRQAQQGWRRAAIPADAAVLSAPHPSRRSMIGSPARRAELLDALIEARRLARA
jgi:L-seryl-tRNA(Ser) seleniumtransferase